MNIRRGMKILCINPQGTELKMGGVYTAGECHYTLELNEHFVIVKGVREIPLLQSRFKPLLLPENV